MRRGRLLVGLLAAAVAAAGCEVFESSEQTRERMERQWAADKQGEIARARTALKQDTNGLSRSIRSS